MGSIHKQKRSPFYWIRFYDKHEPDTSKRRKWINTKIPATPENKKKAEILLKKFELGLAERDLFVKTGADGRIIKSVQEGLAEFLNSKFEIKAGTVDLYKTAIEHLIKGTKKNKIYFFNDQDFSSLIKYFQTKGLSPNSQAIYLRHLHSVFKFWESKDYLSKNIIKKMDQKKLRKVPQPIDLDDLTKILQYYKDKNPQHHYWFVMTLLLTGWRPSTALELRWEDVNFDQKYIRAINVKSSHEFIFPLHKQLEDLFESMEKGRGKVFPFKGSDSLKFWSRDLKKLLDPDKTPEEQRIKKYYKMYQLRKTFASTTASSAKIQDVQTLLDHSSNSVTQDHYVLIKTDYLRRILDEIFVSN